MDRDYSRNIEGSVLRLHWEDRTLFQFVTRRIRVAFDVRQESDVRVWHNLTVGDLRGQGGFQSILRMTLHRPRDVLSLLNQAFFEAGRSGQSKVDMNHVVAAGKQMSHDRLNDLISEYEPIFPVIRKLIEIFRGEDAEWDIHHIRSRVDTVSQQATDAVVRQEMLLVYPSVVDALFGIGFLGIGIDERTFSFCHDGRRRDASVTVNRALVHPCYWMALDCVATGTAELSEIYDEYSIETSRANPSVRHKMIDALVSELDGIEAGKMGATDFEKWCENAIRICFAKGLINVQRNPNPQSNLRRDVVATNVGEGDCWRRMYEGLRMSASCI